MSHKAPVMELFKASGNHIINIGRFEPDAAPKGVFLMLHGFGEHIQRYAELANYLCGEGYAVVIHDQRGFGSMPHLTEKGRKKRLGVAENYDLFLDDIESVRDKIKSWYPGIPVFLWGHSMGGNIALSFILKRNADGFSKVILETPWLRLFKPKSKITVALARVAGKLSSKIRVPSELPLDNISGMLGFGKVLNDDPYYHDIISLRLFTQISDAGEYAIANAAKIKAPVLLLSAENDKIVCSKAIAELAGKCAKNVVYKDVPGGAHSLHNDKEEIRKKALNIILDFCRA